MQEKTRAAIYWKRKEISLLDIVTNLAVAFIIVFLSVKFTTWVKSVYHQMQQDLNLS